MTRLNCGVIHCANNSEGYCCRPEIKVLGPNAHKCADTCCSSFLKEGSAACNSTACHEPNASCDIHCSANKCIHYKNEKCCADSIMVDGSGATTQNDTECCSFSCK